MSNKSRIKELKKVKNSLEKQLKEAKFNQFLYFNYRNVAIIGSTINFLTPYLLSAAVFVGGVKILNGGYPFVTDQDRKYRQYSFDYKSSAYTIMQDEYVEGNTLPNIEMTIFTPWELIDNQYVRYQRSYSLKEFDYFELKDAVLNNDIYYIENNFKNYSETKHISNNIDSLNNNDFYFDVKLFYRDKNDFMYWEESVLKNSVISTLEILCVSWLGTYIVSKRKFSYIASIKSINLNYQNIKNEKREVMNKLDEVNSKIKILSGNERI